MHTLDHMFDPKPVRRLEVITGGGGRRAWTSEEKARILEEAGAPGAVVSEVARRYGLRPQQVFGWRREARRAGAALAGAGAEAGALAGAHFTPVLLEVPPAAPPGPGAIEVAFGGVVVRVPAGMDPATVRAVLRAVRGGR